MGCLVVRKCRLGRNFAPEGRSIIAQHFSAGIRSIEHLSPGGTTECSRASGRSASVVPPGLMRFLVPANPAINRWAIVGCPYGTRGRTPTNAARRYPRLLGFNQALRRLSSISPKQSQLGCSFVVHVPPALLRLIGKVQGDQTFHVFRYVLFALTCCFDQRRVREAALVRGCRQNPLLRIRQYRTNSFPCESLVNNSSLAAAVRRIFSAKRP